MFSPYMARWYVIELGWKVDKFYPYILTIIILVNSAIQVSYSILVHPILVYTNERVVGCPGSELGVFGRAR